MLDRRVWIVLVAVCAFDGYSRFVADNSEKGSAKAAGAFDKADGGVQTLGDEDDEFLPVDSQRSLLAFPDHAPNRLHILYCQS